MQKILVATDGSRGANRAVIAAAQLAKATGAELSILTVGDNYSNQNLRQLIRGEGDIGEALELLSNQILDQARKRAARIGAANIKLRASWGDAAKVIIETAQREDVDVIVIGRRGRGRLAGLLLGSVSQKIASLAPCRVMIVP
ncbi:MAG TPA: universal stress protein [Xanthobacteraceae bacterium]|nr:universal stress protein [Xanthobacteraceae bacterium]